MMARIPMAAVGINHATVAHFTLSPFYERTGEFVRRSDRRRLKKRLSIQ